jgi:hypothetical protein
MGTQFNYAGIQHQTLDQYTGVSDLIANSKNGPPPKQKFTLAKTIYFKLTKIVFLSNEISSKKNCFRKTLI